MLLKLGLRDNVELVLENHLLPHRLHLFEFGVFHLGNFSGFFFFFLFCFLIFLYRLTVFIIIDIFEAIVVIIFSSRLLFLLNYSLLLLAVAFLLELRISQRADDVEFLRSGELHVHLVVVRYDTFPHPEGPLLTNAILREAHEHVEHAMVVVVFVR